MRDRRILPSVTQKGMFLNHAEKLITHRVALKDLPRALAAVGGDGIPDGHEIVKAMVAPGGNEGGCTA